MGVDGEIKARLRHRIGVHSATRSRAVMMD
jgi:hypothetical protein